MKPAPQKEAEYKQILSLVDLYNGKISQPKILEALAVNHDIYIDRGKLQYICRVMKYKLLAVQRKSTVRRVNAKQQDYEVTGLAKILLSQQWNKGFNYATA